MGNPRVYLLLNLFYNAYSLRPFDISPFTTLCTRIPDGQITLAVWGGIVYTFCYAQRLLTGG